MKAALLAGANPNEMDHEPDDRRSYGRPLHCVVGDGPADFLKDNIPLIRLLLEHGADPRLPGPYVVPVSCSLGTPLHNVMQMATIPGHGFEELFECGFYQEAYRIMKQAADDLDSRDAVKKRNNVTTASVAMVISILAYKFLS
ncbi:hypothetical protein N7520_007383 [Penicillium odoratum]|uniref:uncharacterized protein n=1 Tax=Penicillium odoratum TaxID=1167516 RepID=UPI0025484845|nr:uncharacterized protein N7520_007383 [Penicillium odoratum]KAJ5760227.1 hypothetical protein N7520_007383 [Penicillium odoratum]